MKKLLADDFLAFIYFYFGRFRCLLPAEVSRFQPINQIVKDILEQQGHKFHDHYRIGELLIHYISFFAL